MRFARIPALPGLEMRGLAEFAASSDLDLLQLDYRRPRNAPVEPTGAPLFPNYAQGLERPLQSLATQLFLDPQLHIISDAGWCDASACAENAAAELVAKGNAKLLVSAVRGSNLLPILDMLAADGVDLRNRETGAEWRMLKAQPCAADLKLGASPWIAALADGARVVIGGSYDATSPLTAAAMHSFGWKGDQFDLLAMSAAGAQACLAPHFDALSSSASMDASRSRGDRELPWTATVADLQADGALTLHARRPSRPDDASQLLDWLHGPGTPQWGQARADVKADFQRLSSNVTDQGAVTLQGAFGSEPSGAWDVEILYPNGYSAEGVAAANSPSGPTPEELQSWLYARLGPLAHGHAELTIRSLRDSAGPGAWYYLAFRSSDLRTCEQLVAEARLTILRSHGALRWVVSPPDAMVEYEVWATSIPRDAVDIVVDTRPADEWI